MKSHPPYCEGAVKPFVPEYVFDELDKLGILNSEIGDVNLRDAITRLFGLKEDDEYVYRASGTTTLGLMQRAVMARRRNGLLDWYVGDREEGGGKETLIPDPSEITAYTKLFSPTTHLPSALRAYQFSAKKNTLRKSIADHLTSRYQNTAPGLLPSKKQSQSHPHINPYLTFWTLSCHLLQWAGPWLATRKTTISHHVLPVFYHHFGCVVPSFHALWVIAKLAQPNKPSKENVKPILDIGSGNGYWTYMLRRLELEQGMKKLEVYPVDDGTSEYRAMWVPDTIRTSGLEFLSQDHECPPYESLDLGGNGQSFSRPKLKPQGGRNCVLLLVYPQAESDFTGPVLKKFRGDTIVVVGTQNRNGFTGFKGEDVDEWVEREGLGFELVIRIPLPSFCGKDEALFVFRRKEGS
ncbi:hypothetical protein BCR34DRAFT_552997 [Clohesyomyces aquaticus]|uniref:S-adenosyl-L-methionine-dependent methyltransferase n=1 Tax=Clohesyomyces aquaticus TaxID=1231657 RepID=A0A1Y2A8W3_9PLEO|nr:hypothetical protein BCR34DRAFT_552997 [Clohesyomyces aquaticus]